MKYRNKQLTKIQKKTRKFRAEIQSLCDLYRLRMKKNQPRWRQIKKERARHDKKSM